MAQLVVVEDEREIARLIRETLEEEGHQVEVFHDGQRALDRLLDQRLPEPDLIVLDIMLPNVDGLTICREVRRQHVTPILMLTARATELDRVLGLEIGADDYLTKPFSRRELQARTSAILRRVEMIRTASRVELPGDRIVEDQRLRIDPAGHEVLVDGNEVRLTAKEFDLLFLLASHPGRVFNRDYLLDRIWGQDYAGVDRTVDTHVLRLRRKLGGAADRIVTLWGIGYKYESR